MRVFKATSAHAPTVAPTMVAITRTRRSSIDAFLAQPAIALIGASRSRGKFGNIILRELRSKGMRVYPLHPVAATIDGVQCYAHFFEIPEPVGGVIVCVPPADAVTAV